METTPIKSTMNRQTNKFQPIQRKDVFECGICYYQSQARDFTPITVSANFAALECPQCLNNDSDSFQEVTATVKQAA